MNYGTAHTAPKEDAYNYGEEDAYSYPAEYPAEEAVPDQSGHGMMDGILDEGGAVEDDPPAETAKSAEQGGAPAKEPEEKAEKVEKKPGLDVAALLMQARSKLELLSCRKFITNHIMLHMELSHTGSGFYSMGKRSFPCCRNRLKLGMIYRHPDPIPDGRRVS